MRRAALLLLLLLVTPAAGGLLLASTSRPTLTVAAPLVKAEDVGPSGCRLTPSTNATGGSLAVTSGSANYGTCFRLRNTASTDRVYKIRYISGTNEARFDDVRIRVPGGVDHIRWDQGPPYITETSSWRTITPGSTAGVNVEIDIDSGPASVVTAEILVARPGTTDVTASYPLTITFSAS